MCLLSRLFIFSFQIASFQIAPRLDLGEGIDPPISCSDTHGDQTECTEREHEVDTSPTSRVLVEGSDSTDAIGAGVSVGPAVGAANGVTVMPCQLPGCCSLMKAEAPRSGRTNRLKFEVVVEVG